VRLRRTAPAGNNCLCKAELRDRIPTVFGVAGESRNRSHRSVAGRGWRSWRRGPGALAAGNSERPPFGGAARTHQPRRTEPGAGNLGRTADPSGSTDRRAGVRPDIGVGRRRDLTVYDACYLELALRLGLPIASLDKRLCQASIAAGVRLIIAP
jgi:hypothetical protein